jgi:hypothetical protein
VGEPRFARGGIGRAHAELVPHLRARRGLGLRRLGRSGPHQPRPVRRRLWRGTVRRRSGSGLGTLQRDRGRSRRPRGPLRPGRGPLPRPRDGPQLAPAAPARQRRSSCRG